MDTVDENAVDGNGTNKGFIPLTENELRQGISPMKLEDLKRLLNAKAFIGFVALTDPQRFSRQSPEDDYAEPQDSE